MEKMTGGLVGQTERGELLIKLFPPADSFLVELKTAGEYKRGTVLSLESDGEYEVMGKGSGKANAILADDTQADLATALAYRAGHFNRQALIVDGSYTLTETDENDLRQSGIFLSDPAYTPGATATSMAMECATLAAETGEEAGKGKETGKSKGGKTE